MNMMVAPHWFEAAVSGLTLVDYSASSGNAGASSVTVPGTIAAGDVFLLAVATEGELMPTPTGFTLKGSQIGTTNPSNSTYIHLFEMDTLSDGTETSIAYGDSGNHQLVWLFVIRGYLGAAGDAVGQVGSAEASSNSGAVTIPGFTTTDDGSLVLALVDQNTAGVAGSGWTNSDLTGITDLGLVTTTAGFDSSIHAAIGSKPTAGTVGNTTFSLSGSGFWWAALQAEITLNGASGGAYDNTFIFF